MSPTGMAFGDSTHLHRVVEGLSFPGGRQGSCDWGADAEPSRGARVRGFDLADGCRPATFGRALQRVRLVCESAGKTRRGCSCTDPCFVAGFSRRRVTRAQGLRDPVLLGWTESRASRLQAINRSSSCRLRHRSHNPLRNTSPSALRANVSGVLASCAPGRRILRPTSTSGEKLRLHRKCLRHGDWGPARRRLGQALRLGAAFGLGGADPRLSEALPFGRGAVSGSVYPTPAGTLAAVFRLWKAVMETAPGSRLSQIETAV